MNSLQEVLVTSSGPLQTIEEKAKLRANISVFESELKKLTQYEPDLKHTFSHNLYAREMTLKKGALITGAIHRFKNLSIILSGEVSFFSTDGALRVKAPYYFVSEPGVKRVIYAHEDSVWMTCHATSETDIPTLERELVTDNYADVLDKEELELIEKAKKDLQGEVS